MTYVQHFSNDKIMTGFIHDHGVIELKQRANICLYLCNSIMSQQLSVRVAAVLSQRFLALFNNIEPTPGDILATPLGKLREIGLSNAKAGYIHNVAKFADEQGMEADKLSHMTDEEVIQYLTPIKGVGRWTVEMLLMFAMAREDVFAVDDLGIQNAMIKFYKIRNTDKKKFKENMLKRSKKWSPYRTYACLHLWKAISASPIIK